MVLIQAQVSVKFILLKIWPVLSSTCTKYQAEAHIMERCCKCLRFAIRCVKKQSVHLLEPLVKQVSEH